MTPGEFLRAVWPAEGIYCIAIPWVTPQGNSVYTHKTFDDISDAVSHVLRERASKDVYFAVHTLKAHQLWDPEKINFKTGQAGTNVVRVQRNMKASRCFFFDLDVGPEVNKYSDQSAAFRDLKRFCEVTSLPKPLITSSGGGLHVYWSMSDAIEVVAWRTHALKLKQLAAHHGLKVDPSRTTDVSSVLRVADTSNWKDRANPRAVEIKGHAGAETGVGALIKLIDDAIICAGIEVKPAPVLDAYDLGSNTDREFNAPPVSLDALVRSCAQMRRIALMAQAKQPFSEPEWYYGAIGVGRFLENSHRRIQQMSAGHPGYSIAATQEKIAQSEKVQSGPTSCLKIAEVSGVGDSLCLTCPFAGKVHGPIQAARFNDPAPAPQVVELVGETEVVTQIPDPPLPYIRMKGGGIGVNAKNADGDESHNVVYEYDLFPLRRLANAAAGVEQQVWHVTLPRGDAKDFTLDADMLYDSRKFVSAIANQGIYPHRGQIILLQEYMVAYITQLQKQVDADAQCTHLGWTDECTRFILPDKILSADGSARAAQLSLGAQRSSIQIHKRGTLEKQVKLMRFYNDPAYCPNQFMILAGFASTIFFTTGHHGVIINASGDAGASKSSTLYASSSLWGQPELYPINGTNNGATVRGRNERVTVFANLPICVDEITHMPVKDAQDLAMSITQPGHRIRLQQDGVERAAVGSYKATMMLSTGNNSLHGLLSTDNAAGTAGSMRLFEMRFVAGKVHSKHEADNFLHELKENYGHLGEVFIAHCVSNLEAVKARVREVTRQIDIELNIQPSERFWSASVATVLVSGEIANMLGILSFDMVVLRRWIIDVQVPQMRGIVKDEYSDPLAIFADYLEGINNNMLVMEKTQHGGGQLNHVQRKPMGALLAHFDTDDKILYVLKKGFKDYCARIGANSLKVLEDLHLMRDGARIVISPHTKRTLGAGTDFAKAQSWCFSVNMAHAAITGAIDLKVVAGGRGANQQPPDDGSNLRIVAP